MANDTQLVVRIPAELKAALDSLAAQRNMTTSELVRSLLTYELKEDIIIDD